MVASPVVRQDDEACVVRFDAVWANRPGAVSPLGQEFETSSSAYANAPPCQFLPHLRPILLWRHRLERKGSSWSDTHPHVSAQGPWTTARLERGCEQLRFLTKIGESRWSSMGWSAIVV